MKILNKQILSDYEGVRVIKVEITAPLVAKKAKPGQFVVLMVGEEGERLPLTIAEKDGTKGAITLIFQEAGLTTKLMGRLNTGDSLYSLVGPLGHPTEIKKYGRAVVVGGGVGIAEIYPVVKALKSAGNHVSTILGARTKAILILEKELRQTSDELLIATDDGSYGRKGFVTDVLKDLIAKGRYDVVYAVGPIPMMKAVAKTTKDSGIQTMVSLNALMVDGTGMCGCCRVTIGSETKFSCIDGPEFDAQLVDWDELMKRNRIYEEKEKHICKLKNL